MKKFLALFLTLGLFSLVLVGCQGNNSITFGSEGSTNTPSVTTQTQDNSSTSTTKADEDNYVLSNYEISEKELSSTDKKDTATVVEEIVDACVSITASASSASSYVESRGAGVIFSEDEELGFSYIVTCFHVVEDCTSFVVTDDDFNEYEAYLVGGYADEDLAVLAIKETNLATVDILSDSDTLKRGSDVICIGNPLGTLPNSVSKGIISYVNRVINQNSYTKRTLIQTDVAINSGNSGGGLFNEDGLLIGIVSNKYSDAKIDNLGFAIPSNKVLSTVKSILNTAEYNEATNTWKTGYVVGDFEYAFTISLGTRTIGTWPNYRREYVMFVYGMDTNETTTGYGYLALDDIVDSITVKYKDSSKDNKTFAISNITSDTETEIMLFLVDANLELGDTLSFEIRRDNESMVVEFEVTQFIYSI